MHSKSRVEEKAELERPWEEARFGGVNCTSWVHADIYTSHLVQEVVLTG